MSGIRDCKLGDVIKFGNGKARPSSEGEIPIYGGNGILGYSVNLPAKLFLNTQIPAALWFMNRSRSNGHPRKGEILFIDARNTGHLINRRTRELSHEDIQKIADTYHVWRTGEGNYEDIKGFCASTSIERVKELDYVLTPIGMKGCPMKKTISISRNASPP